MRIGDVLSRCPESKQLLNLVAAGRSVRGVCVNTAQSASKVGHRDDVSSAESGLTARNNKGLRHIQQRPANSRCYTNAGRMLVQRLRRWTSIPPALVQRPVFASTRPPSINLSSDKLHRF